MLVEFFKYISRRFDAVVFGIEYTGYGPTRESHTPSMEQTYDDVACGIDHVRQAEPALPMVVWSRSMGCAPALRALAEAGQNACAGLILESPFLSPLMTVVPFRLFFETDFENIDEISKLSKVPILFIHGDCDTVVPSWHTEKLYELYTNGPKELAIVHGGKHNDLFSKHRSFVESKLDSFVYMYIVKE